MMSQTDIEDKALLRLMMEQMDPNYKTSVREALIPLGGEEMFAIVQQRCTIVVVILMINTTFGLFGTTIILIDIIFLWLSRADECIKINPYLGYFVNKLIELVGHLWGKSPLFPEVLQEVVLNYDSKIKGGKDSKKDDWAEEARQALGNVENRVDGYWHNLGLDKAIEGVPNVKMQADEPFRTTISEDQTPVQSVPKGNQLNKLLPGPVLLKAGMDDAEYIRMVKKRLAARIRLLSVIEKDKIRSYQQEVQNTIIALIGTTLKKKKEDDYISMALATGGSAGRFGKHTILEPIIKDPTLEHIISIWRAILYYVEIKMLNGVKYQDSVVDYMGYKKNELLSVKQKVDPTKPVVFKSNKQKDEQGMKVTRWIQAPSIALRVADTKYFSDFNDSYAMIRELTSGKIGIRYIQDISRNMDPRDYGFAVMLDFSDYDGSQSPQKMRWCREVRKEVLRKSTNYTLQQKRLGERYLDWRYEVHIDRTVTTSWGCKIRVYGGLASGDITTSDDNTLRTEAYIVGLTRTINQNKKLTAFKDYNHFCAGDDVLLTYCHKNDERNSQGSSEKEKEEEKIECPLDSGLSTIEQKKYWVIKQEAETVAREMGLFTKFVEVVGPLDATFLTVKVGIATINANIIPSQKTVGSPVVFETVLPYREYERHYKKLCVAYENSYDTGNPEERSKIAAKQISYMCLSIAMPVAWCMSLWTLRKLTMPGLDPDFGDRPWLANTIALDKDKAYDPKHMLERITGEECKTISLRVSRKEFDVTLKAMEVAMRVNPAIKLMVEEIGVEFNDYGNNDVHIAWDLERQSELLEKTEKYLVAKLAVDEKQTWVDYVRSNFTTTIKYKHREDLARYRGKNFYCKHVSANVKKRQQIRNLKGIDFDQTIPRNYTCRKCYEDRDRRPNTEVGEEWGKLLQVVYL